MSKGRGATRMNSRILPPRGPEGEVIPVSLRLARGLIAELDVVAKESGYNRTEVITHFLRWALQEYSVEKSRAPHK